MTTIRIKKGFDLKIQGEPVSDVVVLEKPQRVAILPEKIPFVKPRLMVDIGDAVKIGSLLFVDKRNPEVTFLSPGGGIIEHINFGPRRIIKEIIIKLDESEETELFDTLSENDIDSLSRAELISKLMAGGLWPLIRELPFRDMASPEKIPPGTFVNLGDKEPFQAKSTVYLKGNEEAFCFGLKILEKLCGNVHVTAPEGWFHDNAMIGALVTHYYRGRYPAGDPGVILYHTKTSSLENRSWYIQGQDLLLIAQLLRTGVYPTERIVAFSGSSEKSRSHIKTRMGVPLDHITRFFEDEDHGKCRFIAGGLFKGYASDKNGYLGWLETSLSLIPEGDQREFLGFIRAGFRKPSYSRAFLSYFNSSAFAVDCHVQGGVRACIACGSCNHVCPVDILPQLTFKAILADDVDEFLAHGLLDCVECGLCTYVCPSKIEIADIMKHAKNDYYKEQAEG